MFQLVSDTISFHSTYFNIFVFLVLPARTYLVRPYHLKVVSFVTKDMYNQSYIPVRMFMCCIFVLCVCASLFRYARIYAHVCIMYGVCVCVYIYIYIYIYKERAIVCACEMREGLRENDRASERERVQEGVCV